MLARLRKSAENKDSGFTLIELLVVMIIIGILAAIAIPAFLNQKKKAAETSAKSDATNISKEIAAALVDGPLTAMSPASFTAASGGGDLTMTTAAGNTVASIRLSNGNSSAQVLLNADGTAFTAGSSTSNYCVTVTPTGGASAWSAGPAGLKKGASC